MTPVAMSGIVDSIVGIACSSVSIVICLERASASEATRIPSLPPLLFSHGFVRRCRVVRGASPPQDSSAGVGVRQRFFGSTAAHVYAIRFWRKKTNMLAYARLRTFVLLLFASSPPPSTVPIPHTHPPAPRPPPFPHLPPYPLHTPVCTCQGVPNCSLVSRCCSVQDMVLVGSGAFGCECVCVWERVYV